MLVAFIVASQTQHGGYAADGTDKKCYRGVDD